MALGQTVTEDNDDDDDDDDDDEADDDQNNKEKGKNKVTNIKRSSTDSNNKDLEPTKRISL